MNAHVWFVIAFLLLAAAGIYLCVQRSWALALIAAGLACWVLPAAFQLTS